MIMRSKESNEVLSGLSFEDCCFRFSIIYRDAILRSFNINNAPTTDKSIYFQFELNGLFGLVEILIKLSESHLMVLVNMSLIIFKARKGSINLKEIPVYKNYFYTFSMIILLSLIKSNCYANYKKIDAIVAIAENDIILESELV